MTSFLYSVAGFIVAIGILVTIHEFGHFWVARKVGVKVHRFSVGFGKVVKSWRREGDPTEYALSAIPLGGYVKMLDERVEEVPEAEKDQAFNRKPLWARAAVVAAGPGANYLFAILAMWLLAVWGQDDRPAIVGKVDAGSMAEQAGFQAGDKLISVDGRKIHGWGQHQLYIVHQAFKRKPVAFVVAPAGASVEQAQTLRVDFAALKGKKIDQQVLSRGIGLFPQAPAAMISDVVPGKPAALSGVLAGDVVTRIDEMDIQSWRELVETVSARPNQAVNVTLTRDGVEQVLPMTIAAVERDGKTIGQIGVYPGFEPFAYRLGIWEGLKYAADYTWRFSAVSLRSIGKMFTREIGVENISGPITIAEYAGKTAQYGAQEFISFLVIISISLGLINLLPLPMLDGGHLMYFVIEAIKGSPVSEKAMEWGQQFGIVALALLMSLAFYNDIIRLFSS